MHGPINLRCIILFCCLLFFLNTFRRFIKSGVMFILHRKERIHFVVDHLAKPLPFTCVPSNNLSSHISLHITSAAFLFSSLNSFLIAQYATWDSLPCLETPSGNLTSGQPDSIFVQIIPLKFSVELCLP